MPALFAITAVLGLAIGSFLNVVVYRVPRHESLVKPGSHCPNCNHSVRARHNVPVLGWLMLHGRCADCAYPISVRYPIVELATGAAVLTMISLVLRTDLSAAQPVYLVFGVALTAIGTQLMLRAARTTPTVGLEKV
jgi:leader peptidase (prepilin peptidase)/N-methyltransferase